MRTASRRAPSTPPAQEWHERLHEPEPRERRCPHEQLERDGKLGRLQRLATRMLARALRRKSGGSVAVTLWNGETIPSDATPRFRATLRSPAALARIVLDPEFQLPECYANGSLEIEGGLVELFEHMLSSAPQRFSLRAAISDVGYRAWKRALPDASARDVRRHYDLSNDFYGRWLDESMTYTCAYFASGSETLESAQQAKLELVCRKLALRPGHHVVEAGCGWGSLALYMAREHGAKVTAYNVSREQLDHARSWAKREGLSHRVTFVEDDYRNLTGTFDAFVAVGMLEHVALHRYEELGSLIKRCLRPQGVALVHTIGRHRRLPPPRWTRRRIFPGGYLPALSQITRVFEPNDLCVLDVENLRLHYAKTLEHWLARFEAAEKSFSPALDERFLRTWRLYLASACAGFRTGWLQLFQIVAAHRDHQHWSRPTPPS